MPASFPSSAKSFVTREIGDTIAASHVNDLQLEVAAIESDLLNATPTFLSTVTSGINATALSTGTVPLARLASANTTANGVVDTTTQSFAGGKTFSGVMTITGAATLSNTLGVTGVTTLSNTLAVTGATTLSSTVATGALTVTGAATVSTTLGVTGAATLSSTVATGALTVTGAATVSSTLGVTGAATLSSTLGVTGLITSTGGITGGASSHTTGAFSSTVTGGTYNSQTISSAASLTGTLAVAGATTLTGQLNVNGNIVFDPNNNRISATYGAASNQQALYILQANAGGDTTYGSAIVRIDNRGANPSLVIGNNATTYFNLSAAGLLTVSGFGTSSFSAGGTGEQVLSVQNTTSGVSNYARLMVGAGTNTGGGLFGMSQGYSPSGIFAADSLILYGPSSGGIGIGAVHASGSIRFYSGGSTLRGSFLTDGTLNTGTGSTSLGAGGLNVTGQLNIPNGIITIAGLGSSTGTDLILAGGQVYLKTSSARYKEHITPWIVSHDALAQFVALSPENWDYTDQQSGAAGFISERLHDLPIRNTYGTSPLVNYDSEGRPDSNRDFAIIGLQHLVLQQHDATISQLAARIAALEGRP